MATILGMRLVGDIPREENNGFRTFGQAFTMTLFVMCLEDWGDILEFAAGNGPYALYFVGVVLLGDADGLASAASVQARLAKWTCKSTSYCSRQVARSDPQAVQVYN